MNKKRGKNNIYTHCFVCDAKLLKAYWDSELESYIYLMEDHALCPHCLPLPRQVASESVFVFH